MESSTFSVCFQGCLICIPQWGPLYTVVTVTRRRGRAGSEPEGSDALDARSQYTAAPAKSAADEPLRALYFYTLSPASRVCVIRVDYPRFGVVIDWRVT